MITWDPIDADNDAGRSNPEDRDGMPDRSMKKTFLKSGVTVLLRKAVRGSGYRVTVIYPDGNRAIVEADSRSRAKQIASAYRFTENRLII